LLDDPERRRMLGRAVRDRALELLDPVALDDHERTAYRRLLAAKIN